MSPPDDASDPYAREAQTFPRLSADQARRVALYGGEVEVRDGEMLFSRGERSVDFFLVLDGSVEILDFDADESAAVVTVHNAGQFTGEMDLFNDRQILVSARARGDTKVVRVGRAEFRRLISAEPDIGEIVMRALILRRVGLVLHAQGGVTLVGPAHDGDTLRLQRFMTRNGYPHQLLDTEREADVAGLLECFDLVRDQLPVVILPGREVLRNPTTTALADVLGVTEALDPTAVHDVAVIGGGPAGLAAAVYAASEGLSTIVIEAVAPGGQAGTSSKIENYLGFPTGISGQALAGRAQAQAQKFGARLAIARAAVSLDCSATPYRVVLDGGQAIRARTVVVATGARYRRLDLTGFDVFENAGIHYAATAMEAQLCAGEEVAVVGGGNSAGQAAVFLSRSVRHVHVVVRGAGLAATMSDYLVERIEQSSRITMHAFTEVTALKGEGWLREVEFTNRRTGERTTRNMANLFLMIGAAPNTEWLDSCLAVDERGFVITGLDEAGTGPASPFATSKPGIFAVGDVRSGSVKRVASGVGEGSVVISAIHRFLDPEIA